MVIETLGGYRIVRKLGEGLRATVYLAHPHRAADDAVPAAIKLFNAGVNEQSITTEVEALSRASGPHSAQLLDLTTSPDGTPALILVRYATGSLGRLLRERPDLRVGEAITILAPIIAAVGRLHDSGVTHGGVGPDAVLFDAAGTPTLACFGRATLIAPGLSAAGRDDEPAVTVDLLALHQLSILVLQNVRDQAPASTLGWLEDASPHEEGWGGALLQHLFELGQPLPVDLRQRRALLDEAVPSRLGRSEPVQEGSRGPAFLAALNLPDVVLRLLPKRGNETNKPARRALSVPAPLKNAPSKNAPSKNAQSKNAQSKHAPSKSMASTTALSPGVLSFRDVISSRLWSFVSRARVALSGIRPRFWVMFGAVSVALVLGIALVPPGESGATESESSESLEPTPDPSAPAGDSSDPPQESGADNSDDPVRGDDPLGAAHALLERRQRCIDDLSIVCLDDVNQADSVAALLDREVIRGLQEGGEISEPWSIPGADISLIERLGNSAIIGLGERSQSEPASLLLMKSEAGWRIRDYLEQ